jgi:hypothetical protein
MWRPMRHWFTVIYPHQSPKLLFLHLLQLQVFLLNLIIAICEVFVNDPLLFNA